MIIKFKARTKRVLSCFIAVLMVLAAFSYNDVVANAMTREETQDILDIYTVDESIVSYSEYVAGHPGLYPEAVIEINAAEYSKYSEGDSLAEPQILQNYEGMDGDSVLTAEDAVIEYEFNVAEEGYYSPVLSYYPIKGKSSSIQRAVFVDGNLPYRELGLLEFTRVWKNSISLESGSYSNFVWEKDNQGNDLKPTMIEAPEWINSDFHDSDGYVEHPLTIYLTAGTHTITLHSVREPMLLRSIILQSVEQDWEDRYADVKADWDLLGAKDTSDKIIKIEAEDAVRTSSQMLYPTQHQGSPSITPASAKTLLNNSIGGNAWRITGQWIEWEFDVPETGYYYMSARVNQSFKRGIYVSRKISIDGVVPFLEFADYGFTYNQNWKQVQLANGEDAYRIYLTQGRHTLRMEAVLGSFANIVSEARSVVYDLNSIYRKIIRLTGVAPDKFRDYQIERSLPELTSEMEAVRDTLTKIIDDLAKVAGRRSDRERVLVTMRDQLSDLIKDNEKFGKQIGSFKINVRACGNWLNEAMSQPLHLDSVIFHSPDVEVKVEHDSVFSQIWHEVQRLFYSFVIDYNAIGNVAEESERKVITLWIGSGRDQANVIKSLIDETFTSETNISVNVMLVDMNTLLQATLAGQGPDVAIQVGWNLPMDYGLRNATMDLSGFPDLNEIKKRFLPSAMTPYEYNGATYALPETQVFPMMFYRKDILSEMGLSLPETWEDVNVLLALLARSQMEIGMLPGESLFTTLLYQNGGQYYNEDATRSALDDDAAISAFKKYAEFYTDYKLDRLTSVEERFRTGECPIIIADYTVYNNLQVSAPDLRGIWGMAPIPGTRKQDGSIDRSVGSYGGSVAGTGAGAGGACIVMQATEQPDTCWEFLKWWTSAETQTVYGREMESLMGSSARIPTANIEAFENMPWPAGDLEALKEQFAQTKGIPQVPGGYFSFRNVNNAFYSVTTPAQDQISGDTSDAMPREALTDKVILINDEIRYKRTEFGLPLDPAK